MSFLHRRISVTLTATLLLSSLLLIFINHSVWAQAMQPAPAVVGRDFVAITPPQLNDSKDQIEVIEFFSYGCPHCADFHPLISQWAKKLPADVSFKRVPVSFARAQWLALSRLYYTALSLDELNRLDSAAFQAIHQNGLKLYDAATIKTWAAEKGVDSKKFATNFDSFGIQTQARRADQLAAAHQIPGVPAITVAGRYRILNDGIHSQEELLARTDRVIALVRSEQKKK